MVPQTPMPVIHDMPKSGLCPIACHPLSDSILKLYQTVCSSRNMTNCFCLFLYANAEEKLNRHFSSGSFFTLTNQQIPKHHISQVYTWLSPTEMTTVFHGSPCTMNKCLS